MSEQKEIINQNESSAVVKKTSSKVSIIIPPEIRYKNPLSDYEFTRIFRNSNVVKDFLNSVLELEDEIVTVQYREIKEKGGIKKTDPYFILHCTTGKNKNISSCIV